MITDFTKHHYKRMDCNNYNSATQTGATNKQSVQCLDNDNNLDKDSTLLSTNNLTLDNRKVMLGNTQKYLPESYTTLELGSVIQISAEQQPNSELAESNSIADKSTQNSNPFVTPGNTQKYLPESYAILELGSVIQISAEQQPNSELAESNPIADKSTRNSNPFNENSFKKNKSTKTCDAIFEMDDYVKDVMHGFILTQQNNYSNNDVTAEPLVKSPVKSPVKPQPVKPQPVKSQPVEPQPVEPQPVEPQPVEPQPVELSPVEPPPIEPPEIPEVPIVEYVAKPVLSQPPLGKTVGEETAIFLEMIKPFKDLDPKQKQAAVFSTMQARVNHFATYGLDQNTEGVMEYYSNVSEMIADRYKSMDCDDHAILFRFYAGLARTEKMLPETAKFYNLSPPGHLMFCYGTPTDNGWEYYIVDNNTMRLRFRPPLITLKEFERDVWHKPIQLSGIDFTVFPLNKNDQIVRYIGSKMDWVNLLYSDTTVRDSISEKDIFRIHDKYVHFNGEISLPDDYNEEYYKSYAEAVQYLDLIDAGFMSRADYDDISIEDFNLTMEHARHLIGRYSTRLNRNLTVEDLNISIDWKYKLIGAYSSALKRNLSAADVGYKTDSDYEVPESVRDYIYSKFEGAFDWSILAAEKPLDNNEAKNLPSTELDLNVHDTTTEEKLLDFDVENNLANNMSFFSKFPDLNTLLATATPAILGCATNVLLGGRKHNDNVKKENFITLYSRIIDQATKHKHNDKTSPKDLHSLKKILSLHSEAIDHQASSNLAYNTQLISQILLFDKMPLDFNKLQLLTKNLLALYESSDVEDSTLPKNRLLKLLSKLEDQDSFDLTNKDNLESANKVLKFYGMKIEFNTDKILGSTMLRSNAKAFNQLLKIDTSVFYSFLSKINKVIPYSELEKIVNNNIETFIKLENELENYYAPKLAFHKIERNNYMLKSIVTCIPAIPGNDIVSIMMRVLTIAYIDDKLIAMQERVDNTKQFIATSSLTEDEKSFFESKISSLNNTKISHLDIKRNRAIHLRRVNIAYTGISVATLAVPAVLYPAKAATRFVANSSIRIYYIKKRYQEDKLNRKHSNHVTTKDMYLLLKDSYLKAIQTNDLEKADIMANLAENLFGISAKGFKLLIKTQAVETNRVKLNLYQPIDANDN